jgi:hypothetical protein
MAPPLGREEMPEGVVLEVQLDQDGIEVLEEDEDGEITEQARSEKVRPILAGYPQATLRKGAAAEVGYSGK